MARGPVKELTQRQAEILEWIKAYIKEHRVAPLLKEVSEGFKVKPPTMLEALNAMEKKGYLDRRREMGPRAMLVTSPKGISRRKRGMMPIAQHGRASVSIVGRVAAGEPILAEENIIGTIRVDALMAQGRCFALEVDGDSMVDIGIPDGGLVIVRQQPVAENGDVVVAMLNGADVTVKRLSIDDSRIELRSENEKYEPIPVAPDSDLRILGKVLGVRERNC